MQYSLLMRFHFFHGTQRLVIFGDEYNIFYFHVSLLFS